MLKSISDSTKWRFTAVEFSALEIEKILAKGNKKPKHIAMKKTFIFKWWRTRLKTVQLPQLLLVTQTKIWQILRKSQGKEYWACIDVCVRGQIVKRNDPSIDQHANMTRIEMKTVSRNYAIMRSLYVLWNGICFAWIRTTIRSIIA